MSRPSFDDDIRVGKSKYINTRSLLETSKDFPKRYEEYNAPTIIDHPVPKLPAKFNDGDSYSDDSDIVPGDKYESDDFNDLDIPSNKQSIFSKIAEHGSRLKRSVLGGLFDKKESAPPTDVSTIVNPLTGAWNILKVIGEKISPKEFKYLTHGVKGGLAIAVGAAILAGIIAGSIKLYQHFNARDHKFTPKAVVQSTRDLYSKALQIAPGYTSRHRADVLKRIELVYAVDQRDFIRNVAELFAYLNAMEKSGAGIKYY